MNNLSRLYLFIIICCSSLLTANAKDYSLAKGQTMTLNCTATAPAGTITHAFFQLVNAEDAQYLGIVYTSSDCRATLYGLKAKNRIPVEVTYSYSYRGSYDNNMHVGSGSYTDYITVTGPREATSIKIKEGNQVKIAPGQSATLHIEFYPKGSEGSVDWGFLDLMGNPFCFDTKYAPNGYDIIVTGKKVGSAYLLALLNGDQKTAEVIQVICTEDAPEAEKPTSIDIIPDNVNLTVGDTENLSVSFTPENSYSNIKWASSNPSVVTVDESGCLKAISAGTAEITALSENNITAIASVTVKPLATGFNIENSINVAIGYSYQLTPKIFPANASPKFKYESSDKSIVTVSQSGLIQGVKEGSAIVTISCDGVTEKKEITINITKATPGADYRNAKVRVQAVKSLFNHSVIVK